MLHAASRHARLLLNLLATTPPPAPTANAFCERLIGPLRRDCLDNLIIFDDLQAERILREHVRYYTDAPIVGFACSRRPAHAGCPLTGQRRRRQYVAGRFT